MKTQSKTRYFNSKKKINEHEHEEEQDSKSESAIVSTMLLPSSGDDDRLLGLFGEVDEAKSAQLIGAMIEMSTEEPKSKLPDDDDEEDSLEPFEFIISTHGGTAEDMFAIYDVMRDAREKCDIVTYGLGKVMSAGVLLLAAGTKGKRKIGKNCRVMIHSVVAGNAGSYHNLENEMQEITYTQEAYIKALSEETNMSIKELKKLIEKKVNVYLSAQEAIKLGIADIIV